MGITSSSTLAEVRQHAGDLARRAVDIRNTPETERGDTWAADLKATVDELMFVDQMERGLTIAARTLPEPDREPTGPSTRGRGRPESWGEQVTRSAGYTDRVNGRFEHEVRALIGEASGLAGGSAWLPGGTPTGPVMAWQPTRLRDLMGGANATGLASIPYIRELNAVTNETGATGVKEGSAKPEATIEFDPADAPVRKIAAWVPVTSEIIEDAPTLATYIDRRLAFMLQVREEAQIVSGNGTAPNLTGILATTGIVTASAVTGDVPAIVANAAAQIEGTGGAPEGIVMHPTDFWAALSARHATGIDGSPNVITVQGTSGSIWGIPVVRSRATVTGTAIVGAWRTGATLWQRSGVTIKRSDSHDDYFTKNKVAVLAEERIALSVEAPSWFARTPIT